MDIATYPGSASPLRGLQSFAESERDVFFGRERELTSLAKLVTADGFRAGLFYGEHGVGKTSLIHAALAPHLRDHGVITVFCDDNQRPLGALSGALSRATNTTPVERENPTQFLNRVIGNAVQGQLFVFVLDEIGEALATHHEQVVTEIGDLYTRVVTRSGGRARFLFACASENVHAFGALERRTGSLFPPSNRFELRRFDLARGTEVLDRTLQLAGLSADSQLAEAVVHSLAGEEGVLPADLQMSALAIATQHVTTVQQFQLLGDARELQRRWIGHTANATGDERSALRLLGALAADDKDVAHPTDWTAARASVDATIARQVLKSLRASGVVDGTTGDDNPECQYKLAHRCLIARVREVAAPAHLAAQRAYELLGSKSGKGSRLRVREWWQLRSEGIVPANTSEQKLIARTVFRIKVIMATAIAAPLLLLAVVYASMHGSYYLDVSRGDAANSHVIVRAGKPGLYSAFHWLPASPGFGSVVADTGLRRRDFPTDLWISIGAGELRAALDETSYADLALDNATADTRALMRYAQDGNELSLNELRNAATTSDRLASTLEALVPIARGGPAETQWIVEAMDDVSPLVRTAALRVASANLHRSEGYQNALTMALASDNIELRRIAFAVVRVLDEQTQSDLFSVALASAEDETVKRELLGSLAEDANANIPNANSAARLLASSGTDAEIREESRRILSRAFSLDSAVATMACGPLVDSETALAEDRIFALEQMRNHEAREALVGIANAIEKASQSSELAVRAAAMPLRARLNPDDFANSLAVQHNDPSVPAPIQVAAALAWGEIAQHGSKDNAKAARGALEGLLTHPKSAMRSAAAAGYGRAGQMAQVVLAQLIKKENNLDVARGAAQGLANSVLAGGRSGTAVSALSVLWRKKNRPRRIAADAFAQIASKSPAAVVGLLTQAASMANDASLHPIGVRGLCNAVGAGHSGAARSLAQATTKVDVAVRRQIAECALQYSQQSKGGTIIALALASDSDTSVRTTAARVLLHWVATQTNDKAVNETLTEMTGDAARQVRLVAVQAVSRLGSAASDSARRALPAAFANADEAEKLALAAAAQKIGAPELVAVAASDSSAAVRVAAIDTAVATQTNVASTVNSALADANRDVRVAALRTLARGNHGLSGEDVDQALAVAIHDNDPQIAEAALTTLAQRGQPEKIEAVLGQALDSTSESMRATAARACQGLVADNPDKAKELLEKLLQDPSTDVRRALFAPLASAYAATWQPDKFVAALDVVERHPTKRLVLVAALVMLSQQPSAPTAPAAALKSVADNAPPLAAQAGRIGLGLVQAGATDPIEFLRHLVP